MNDLISRVKKALEFRSPCILDHVNGSNYTNSVREHGAYVEHARTEKLVKALVDCAEHLEALFCEFSEEQMCGECGTCLRIRDLESVLEEMEKK